jgi:hypothetical protein
MQNDFTILEWRCSRENIANNMVEREERKFFKHQQQRSFNGVENTSG